jgi:MoxR-like ATPase
VEKWIQVHPDHFKKTFEDLTEYVGTQLRGKPAEIRMALVGLFARGHVLVEDLPGAGKTMLARTLAGAFEGGTVKRVQGTPDLLPADIQGSTVYNRGTGEFDFVEGPVFADILHCDEINRIPPRTQSALLEAMEERHVTVRGEPLPIKPTFFVIATQNPHEMAGTYPLPEAQLDRFLMRISLGYPTSVDAEIEVLADFCATHEPPAPILPLSTLPAMVATAETVHVDRSMLDYVARIVRQTRTEAPPGASPRAGLQLVRAAKVLALADGRGFVQLEDVSALAEPVLEHRLPARTRRGLVRDILDGQRPLPEPVRGRRA